MTVAVCPGCRMSRWVPRGAPEICRKCKEESPDVLRNGAWVTIRGIQRWVANYDGRRSA